MKDATELDAKITNAATIVACRSSDPWHHAPQVIVIKPGRWFRRPVLWLMCPYAAEPGKSFQVGVFRDWRSANLACERLAAELRLRSAD